MSIEMASMLWQTSFIVRALAPLSLDHAFRHLRLLIHLGDGDDYILHTLCLSLLRAAAPPKISSSSTSSPFCVAFPESDTTISVVFPASRKMEMEHAVQHVLTSFPEIQVDCTAVDEFGCGLAMENALLGSLAAALVCAGWIVFEGNLAVHGGITEWIDGAPTEAIAFAVHTELNDCIDFLLSPDVIRFRRFKIERFLTGPLKRLFDGGAVAILDNYLENMSPDDIQELKCLTIPSMKEGFVSGWDFFNSGKLKLKSILQRETQNLYWTTANSTLQTSQIRLNDNNFDLDLTAKVSNFESEVLKNFRRPKLPPPHYAGSRSTEPSISDTHGVDDLLISGHSICSNKPVVASIPTNLGVPVFLKRKIRVQTPGAVKADETNSQKETLKICMEQGKSSTKKPQGIISKSIACDTVISLPKKKRVCAEREKNANKKLQVANSKSIVGENSAGSSLLKKKKAPDCSQPSIQKLEMLSTAWTDASNAMIEPSTCVKQLPRDKSLLANGPIEQQEQQATLKTKDHNAPIVATSGEKKSARGEKKTIDSETNQKKVLIKYAAGKLSDLTVPELKLFLSENKAKVSGKKEELVHRVVLILSSVKPL